MASLKDRLLDDMKAAMRSGEKSRLGVIRMARAEIKRREVDDQIELDDAGVLALLDKMIKQRRDSLAQYEQADREDLAAVERAEIDVLQIYLPEPLSAEELAALIDQVIADTGAAGMADMGKVMGALKPQVQGRADMGKISGEVRARLAASRT